MKARITVLGPVLFSILLVFGMLSGCSDSSDEPIDTQINNDDTTLISEEDEQALLFMLEEEKLARDTYQFLNDYWDMVQFENIMQSEQSHMNAVETLLKAYRIPYEILENGKFTNEDLQAWYNKFVEEGVVDEVAALTIGATIEDLDIVDLEDHIQATSNPYIIEVFSSLQCGSRNHLRSFVQSIENLGSTYEPQFLSQEAYDAILEGSHEQCN
ncbi:DUF2202 domain-containing protein [Flagellimonas olearia]|uniref:DUF2202 domain-containing protein n=1 Tax=Flagellimonas olearia TaxID=552546 RepID=A0A6I1DZX2_9FLAO|nr:DUF2202 domain-containing protein [Allomuricauda olearia]KAB7528907.1 DUF2202 domain-containing protein [Allomuricauda olearia]